MEKQTISLMGCEGVFLSVDGFAQQLATFQESTPKSFFLLAEKAGEIVGTCNCNTFRKPRLNHRAEIGISVKKGYWGKGIGRQLLMEMIAKARQINIKLLSLEVRRDNS
ncbi:N-acetyltransferase family protein [Streptococcus dentiloxodontae]